MTAGQQLTVYRLAQESLTNAFKHGDRSKGTHLHLVWTAASLELRSRSSLITSPARDAEDDPIRSWDSRHAGSRRSCRRMGGNSPGRRDLRSAGVPPLSRS